MGSAAQRATGRVDLGSLDAVTAAVESGAGLPEVVRAAARALDASVAVSDRGGSVLAVAARSSSDEATLLADGERVELQELRVGDQEVGILRLRPRAPVDPVVLRLVCTLVASEVERVRAPARASADAAEAFFSALLAGELAGSQAVAEAAGEVGVDLAEGSSMLMVRVHAHVAGDDGRRARALSLVDRAARGSVTGALCAPTSRSGPPGEEIVVLLPAADETAAARAADSVQAELVGGMSGNSVAIGISRPCTDPGDLTRAAAEATLAVNVAEGEPDRPPLAFEQTGAYRLLLPAMADDPEELHRFYEETVQPLVAYDEQYETDLLTTVETFLEADGNVAGTAQRLFTHRHTVRYRLERVRELSGLDVGSSDGREKLSLGLKAMRVLGISRRGGPATEAGAGAGRIPGRG